MLNDIIDLMVGTVKSSVCFFLMKEMNMREILSKVLGVHFFY